MAACICRVHQRFDIYQSEFSRCPGSTQPVCPHNILSNDRCCAHGHLTYQRHLCVCRARHRHYYAESMVLLQEESLFAPGCDVSRQENNVILDFFAVSSKLCVIFLSSLFLCPIFANHLSRNNTHNRVLVLGYFVRSSARRLATNGG